MIVTLINKVSINSITLPEKIRGQYWIYDCNDRSKKLIGIEGINGEWILKSNKDVKVLDHSGKHIRNTVLSPLSIYNLDTQEPDNKTIVFIEPSTVDRQTFTKYLVDKDIDITIGRTEKNDVVLNNHFVSASHATLSFRNGKWSITDLTSTNGTFVDGDRVKSRDLSIGDMIYIMGYKMIGLIGFQNVNLTIYIIHSGIGCKPFIINNLTDRFCQLISCGELDFLPLLIYLTPKNSSPFFIKCFYRVISVLEPFPKCFRTLLAITRHRS